MKTNNKGISLVVLVITIIVMIVLAGVVIISVVNDSIIPNSKESKILNDLSNIEEKVKYETSRKLMRRIDMTKGQYSLSDFGIDSEYNDYIYVKDGKLTVHKDAPQNIIILAKQIGYIKEGELPKEFTQVEYIESTGEQYIDTNVKVNNSQDIKIIFQGSNNNGDTLLFGARTSATSNNFSIYFNDNFIELDYGSYTKNRIDVQNIGTNKAILEILGNNKFILNEIENELNEVSFETEYNVYLFNANGNQFATKKFVGRIYYCKIASVRDFIPCYSNTTVTDVNGKKCPAGTAGLYDLVEGKFYTNQGTGEFGIPTE